MMASILRLEFFGRVFSTPLILRSCFTPLVMIVIVRPATWSVPKRLIASACVMTAVSGAVREVPEASGRLTTLRKSSLANNQFWVASARPSLTSTGSLSWT